ncbi:3'-5' exoribonuclease [Candidatus Kaiserbacteria bacterium]|nr:3'-5' exoribonuclease [Candidatus Kaiserbacteria bacterium]
MTFKPFTDNIIFYDTEFSSLDPYKGEIISIGAVKMNGEEFYCELEFDGEYSDWVKENLLYTLTAPKVSRAEAQELLLEFVGPNKPYMLAYVNQFDTIYTHKLFGGREVDRSPFYWLPLDFASVLVGLGYNPEVFKADDYTKLAKELGVPIKTGHTHNALDDAKFLREIYLALITKR